MTTSKNGYELGFIVRRGFDGADSNRSSKLVLPNVECFVIGCAILISRSFCH